MSDAVMAKELRNDRTTVWKAIKRFVELKITDDRPNSVVLELKELSTTIKRVRRKFAEILVVS